MLSDAELRKELLKLGVSAGPITDSTRSLYRKRLEKLRKENATKQSETLEEVKKLVGKPLVMPPKKAHSAPAVKSTRRRNTIGYSTDESEEDKAKDSRTPHARTTRQSTRNSFATSKEIEVKSRTPVHKRVKALTHTPRSSPRRRSGSFPNQDRYSDDSSDASEGSGSWIDLQSAETNTSPSLVLNTSNMDNSSFRKLRDDDSNSQDQRNNWDREEKENIDRNATLQRRGLYGRRLRTLRDPDKEDNFETKNSIRNGNITSTPRGYSKSTLEDQTTNDLLENDHDVDSVKIQPWTLNFSSFLPIGTCIFFIVLALLYVTMKYDTNLNSGGLQLDYERNNLKDSADKYLEIASQVYDHVGIYAGARVCGDMSLQDHVPIRQVSSELQIQNEKGLLRALEKFIENPEWGIVVYDSEHNRLNDAKNYEKAKYIDSEHPILSGWCRFTRALQKVLFRILLTTAVGILIWLGLVYRRYRIEKQREEREQMYVMVQKILDVLRKQYELSENNDNVQPFLPILHVRDMILAPHERKKMEKIWDRAKQFLSASETRIRVENQRILGEDYLVWRWIQAVSPAKRYTHTSRLWQGEAFDISKSINRPMICPTPCLKIRNMFDVDMEDSKDWVTQIQDSILEKCQGNNEILRICVEKDSREGLVYMLCASNLSAGRAFQALHGAWFDGRLVTVKFIRLERFHHRFPDSVNQAKVPMRPTSAVPVSTIMSSPSTSNEPQAYEKLYPTLPKD